MRRTIYYRHVPLVRDRQLSKGCPRAALRASQSDRNNIPYIDIADIAMDIIDVINIAGIVDRMLRILQWK